MALISPTGSSKVVGRGLWLGTGDPGSAAP
jgi:hypothetical protein